MGFKFPRKPQYALRLRRGISGFGLFADELIPKGAFVIEYWGELLDDDEANERRGMFLFQLENGYTIDGKIRQNTARYINHSCNPNCTAETVGRRLFMHATKVIPLGAELTFDYGREYFDAYIKPKGCKCGSC